LYVILQYLRILKHKGAYYFNGIGSFNDIRLHIKNLALNA